MFSTCRDCSKLLLYSLLKQLWSFEALFIFFKKNPNCSFLSTPISIYSLLFLFRKGQASHEYQPNVAYQVAVRLGVELRLDEATQNDEKGSKSCQKSQRLPTVRSLTTGLSYTTITCMQRVETVLMGVM